MFRRLAAVLLIALALATLGLYARAVMSPLTLSIGSAPIALVQAGAVTTTQGSGADNQNATATLAAPSTAGTALVFVAGGITGTITSMPAGFVQLAAIAASARYEVWVYLNNPGGITAVTGVSGVNSGSWTAAVSEWSGVRSASSLDASGTASSVGGTTLAVTTSANVLLPGDLALIGWNQRLAGAGAVTFTTPAGWTRVIDNGSDATTSHHIDVEYWLNPAVGSPLAATLTSTGTTNPAAAGAIVVLKAAPPITDQTAMLAY